MTKWRNVRFGAAVALVLAASPMARPAEVSEEVRAMFAKAGELLNTDKFAEALPLLVEVAKMVPDRPGAIWNLGIAAAAVGDNRLALDTWLHYREMLPDDLKGIEKVLQSYQALEMLEERDQLRGQLVAYRAALPAAEREKLLFFARDQFDAAGMHFIVLEYFEPRGRFGDLYRFTAMDAAHNQVYYFAIESGSAEFTAIARELGEIGKNERIYSLDKFQGQTHSTYLMMKSLPPYEAVRALVVSAAEGKLPVASSSTR